MVARLTTGRTPLRAALLFLASVATAGCATGRGAEPVAVVEAEPPEPPWRVILSDEDIGRLERVDEAWAQALATARSAGFDRSLGREGLLLQPDAAQLHAALPPGSYRCRLVRIGAAPSGRRAYISTGTYFCHVGGEGENLSLTKQTGTDKPGGYVFHDGLQRSVFIGSRAMSAEEVPPAYGERPDRNVVGVIERIEPFRYRLVVPYPPHGAILDVYELVPALR